MFSVLRLLVPLALLLAACGSSEASPERDASGRSPLAVHRGAFNGRLLLTGELVAEDALVLEAPHANIWPLVVRWLVEDGARVREGERIVEFDNSQLTANLEELRARGVEAGNELASRRARAAADEVEAAFEVERARAELEKARLKAEVPEGLLADKEYEERQLALETAELELEEAREKLEAAREAGAADVEVQRIELEKARTALRRAEERIELLTVRAPRDGIVLLGEAPREGRQLQVGDSTWPGLAVARMPDLATLIVEARLFDVDDGRLAPDTPVTTRLDAFPEATFAGRVREVDRIAQQAGRFSLRRTFRVTIDLESVDPERMRPGMSVKVVAEAPQLEDALLLPRRSLEWRDGAAHALLAAGGSAPVELGPCNGADCVVEDGLAEGTRLRPVEVGS